MADALLTDAELAEIGDDLAFARPDLCTVLRKPSGRDAGGAPASGAWQPVGAYGCRIEASNRQAAERVLGGALATAVDYLVALPRDAEVRGDDRVHHDRSGATFEVVSSNAADSFRAELVVACTVLD